jgi:hypothetical protein
MDLIQLAKYTMLGYNPCLVQTVCASGSPLQVPNLGVSIWPSPGK